jgi:hypothetical protein
MLDLFSKELRECRLSCPLTSSEWGRQSRAGVLIHVAISAKASSSVSNFRGGFLRASLAASRTTQTARGAQSFSELISQTRRGDACRLYLGQALQEREAGGLAQLANSLCSMS